MKKTDEIGQRLLEWQKMNTAYINTIKTLLAERKSLNRVRVIGYFTHSFHIYHKLGHENLCLGTFHIQNLGSQALSNPYICIKISSDSLFHFSGKYVYKDSKLRIANAWERINEATDRQEYWLKPTNKNILNPDESITFSNFQAKWLPTSSYTGSIMGFVYGDEIKDGIGALNQINVGGTVDKGDKNG